MTTPLSSVPDQGETTQGDKDEDVLPSDGPHVQNDRPPMTRGVSVNWQPSANDESLYKNHRGASAASIRNNIARYFSPRVAVLASSDVDKVAQDRGFNSATSLLRPFGNSIQDEFQYRDINGNNKIIRDFSVRFITMGQAGGRSVPQDKNSREEQLIDDRTTFALSNSGDLRAVEKSLDNHFQYLEREESIRPEEQPVLGSAPFQYALSKILSSFPLAAHETFSHPSACLICISSHCTNPLDVLLTLYKVGNQAKLPNFVDPGYLRYYLFLHDDSVHDMKKSLDTFELMRRNFGSNCHFVSLQRCYDLNFEVHEEDFIQLNASLFPAVAEDIDISATPYQGSVDSPRKIHRIEYKELSEFARCFVMDSLLPFLERCLHSLNEQVAAPRKGITGRFFSASKRYFGTGSRNSSGTFSSSGQMGNYDPGTSSYSFDTPEAQLRRMADIAFILRDWKLALSTYEMCRKDFDSDKAWMYYAGAHEMVAICTIIQPQYLSTKMRVDVVNPEMDTALYTYSSRCSAAYASIRCLLVCTELLYCHGGPSRDNGAEWLSRMLENAPVGRNTYAAFIEQMAEYYNDVFSMHSNSNFRSDRMRKSALWRIIAVQHWLRCGKPRLARSCLLLAGQVYDGLDDWDYIQDRVARLRRSLSSDDSFIGTESKGYRSSEEKEPPKEPVTLALAEKHKNDEFAKPQTPDITKVTDISAAQDPLTEALQQSSIEEAQQ